MFPNHQEIYDQKKKKNYNMWHTELQPLITHLFFPHVVSVIQYTSAIK